MQASQLTTLLGRPASDLAVERALDHFKIRRLPEVEIDDECIDGPLVKTQDWLKNRKAGVEFGFDEEDAFLGRPAKKTVQPAYTMLLTQLYFYGDHDKVSPFVDALPEGLLLADDRATVRQKLAKYEPTRRSYVRDTWELPDYQLIVSYAKEGACIGFIVCALRPPPSPDEGDVLVVPELDDLIAVLGKRMDDPTLRRAVRTLGIQNHLEDMGDTVLALMRKECGLELSFGGVKSMDASAFTRFDLFRDREDDARGWAGKLPRGLKFDDSPETMFRKMVQPPDELDEEDFVGHALWHFPDYSVQIKFSTMYNWILTVSIFGKNVWASY